MPDVFHANRIEMAATLSNQEGDQGDVLLIFQCVGPDRDNPHAEMVLGQIVIGMTYASTYEMSQMLQQQLEHPIDPRYKGPRIRQT